MNLHFPYGFDGRGRTAADDEERWVRGLVEQVLFTAPGERVNRPDFGSGLEQLVFAPASVELAATTQMLVQGALERWLGELVEVEQVEVRADDAALEVTVAYRLRRTGARQVHSFTQGGAP
jgi:hypothetical protein